MIGTEYKEGSTFQLLLKGSEAAGVIEEWYYRGMGADIRIRKAKTKGHSVIETEDPIFASWIVQFHPGTKVNIKEP